MQLFKYLPSVILTCLVLAYAPASSQQTEEKEETRETEIIIITSFNGIAVTNPKELVSAVQQSPGGEDVVVEIMRDGAKMTKTVIFGKK